MTKILGFRELDFTDQSGKEIKGTRLYVSDDSNDLVTGVSTDSVFVPSGRLTFKPVLGQAVDLRYNKYGKIDRVDVITSNK